MLRALRTAAIASLNPSLIDIDSLGASHADAAPRAAEDVRDEPRGGRLPIHSRDGDDWNASRFAGGEERADDRFADRPRFADRWLQVHPQARGRIHFDDHSALSLQRATDIERDDIHAGH